MSRAEWSAEDDARLVALWAEGLSAARIGLELGRPKGSIVGRVRRLGLTPRKPTLVPRQRTLKPRPVAPKPPALVAPERPCQWPEGERRCIRWCDAPAVPGRAYCVEHCKRAFVGFGRSPWLHGALAS